MPHAWYSALAALLCGHMSASATCLDDVRTSMEGISHHGPNQIDGRFRTDRRQGRTEVKFVFPNRVSIGSHDANGFLTFGAVDIDDRAWRLDRDRRWIPSAGEDPYSLKNEIARGSGDFELATHVFCPDPTPNFVDHRTHDQYPKPFVVGMAPFRSP